MLRASWAFGFGLLLTYLAFVGAAVAHESQRPRAEAAQLRAVRRSALQAWKPRRRLAAVSHATAPPFRPNIVGGSTAPQGTWGFMAFIVHSDASGNPDFLCSGTVVSPNVVLTAGHCTVDGATGMPFSASGYAVVTGAVDWTDASRRQVSPVSRVIPNPGYNLATTTGDAGLLVLSVPITAPAIRLAGSSDQQQLQPGTGAGIAGWGNTSGSSGSVPPTQLRQAPTVVQSASYCAQHAPAFDASSELCALDYPSVAAGTCVGDSGGPLVAADSNNRDVEIGITSRGPADCSTTLPDVYTRVDQISAWAAGWIAAVAPAPPTPTPPSALPQMGSNDAKSYVHQTLAGVFGRTFTHAQRYTATCNRKSRTRFTCGVTWFSSPNHYFGSVTVYYRRRPDGTVAWDDTYAISSVNDHCYFHSRHSRRCLVNKEVGSL